MILFWWVRYEHCSQQFNLSTQRLVSTERPPLCQRWQTSHILVKSSHLSEQKHPPHPLEVIVRFSIRPYCAITSPPTRQSFSIFTHSWKYDTANHLVWPKPGTWPPPTFYLQQSPDMRTPLALFCNNSPFTLPRRSQTAKSNSLLCLIDEVGSAFSKLQTSETFAFRCRLTAATLLYPVSLVSGCWDRWSSQKSKYQYKDHLVGY